MVSFLQTGHGVVLSPDWTYLWCLSFTGPLGTCTPGPPVSHSVYIQALHPTSSGRPQPWPLPGLSARQLILFFFIELFISRHYAMYVLSIGVSVFSIDNNTMQTGCVLTIVTKIFSSLEFWRCKVARELVVAFVLAAA